MTTIRSLTMALAAAAAVASAQAPDADLMLINGKVFTAYTAGSAYAEFTEREKGRVAPGMLADVAVLSQDIFAVPAEKLPTTNAELTIISGQIVCDKLRP